VSSYGKHHLEGSRRISARRRNWLFSRCRQNRSYETRNFRMWRRKHRTLQPPRVLIFFHGVRVPYMCTTIQLYRYKCQGCSCATVAMAEMYIFAKQQVCVRRAAGLGKCWGSQPMEPHSGSPAAPSYAPRHEV
jgi:hypothetical protein